MGPGDLRLVVGLGNPGSKYIKTRHNIGFMAVEKFAQQNSLSFKKQKNVYGQLAEMRTGENQLKLLLPETFMNESGKSVRACLDWYDLNIRQILVLVDDMDLPLGKVRLRGKGSAGGHNGLRSAIQHLKTEDFCRLRIGIGPPEGNPQDRKAKTISHVLGGFTDNEKSLIEQVLDEVVVGVTMIQTLGITKASNHLNSFAAISLENND